MTTLLIARHGNTFDTGDTILRVGKRTDLALSHSGREQAKRLGIFLKENYPHIQHIFVSSLKRTQETALIASSNTPFVINPIFDEIDYGVDDGKPESQVVERIGKEALKQWEENGLPPEEWKLDRTKIIQDWKNFFKNCVEQYPPGTTILVVTSNGIARFAPFILDTMPDENLAPSLKMKTGAISSFQFTQERGWQLEYWNVLPA